MSEESSTIVFFPEGAFGPTNNCVGIGDVLRRRGHRVVFIVEESFAGTLAAQGFEERLMRLTPPPETEEAPGQFWKDFIRDTAPVFRTSTREQLADFIAPTFQALIDGARYVDERLREIIDELQPDLIVEDNVVAFPALPACGRPWARIMSCNPTEMKDPQVPPPFSGLPSNDTSGWDEYWHAYRDAHREMHAAFSEFCQERGAPPLPADDFIHESPWLNMYLYPDEVDYRREQPLGPTWHNLQASVRATDPAWELPDGLRGEEPLVYLSLGSLGSADVPLMEKLVAELAEAPYRVIVSKGPQHTEFELAANMAGEEFLPQTEILPKVDLVITHGGHGTVTRSLAAGVPVMVVPISRDQPDNAARVVHHGVGINVSKRSSPEKFATAVRRVLADDAIRAKAHAMADRLAPDVGAPKAIAALEELASADGGRRPRRVGELDRP